MSAVMGLFRSCDARTIFESTVAGRALTRSMLVAPGRPPRQIDEAIIDRTTGKASHKRQRAANPCPFSLAGRSHGQYAVELLPAEHNSG